MRRWGGRPLLGPGREGRPLAWALLTACVVIVFGIGLAVAHQTAADGLDRWIDDPVIDLFRGHHTLLTWMQFPGTEAPAVVLSAAMAAGCLWQRRLNGVVLALFADLIATQLDEALFKPLFHRTYLGAVAYPSGHTTSVVSLLAVYVVLFMGWRKVVRYRGWRVAGLVLLLALTVITVLGVLGLRWHYFTDTVGGAAVAVGTVCGLSLALDAAWRALGLTAPIGAPSGPDGAALPKVRG